MILMDLCWEETFLEHMVEEGQTNLLEFVEKSELLIR